MAKLIALSEEAYKELFRLKSKKESFSTVVLGLIAKKKRKSLLDFAGKWPGEKARMERVFDKILKERHSYKMRKVGF